MNTDVYTDSGPGFGIESESGFIAEQVYTYKRFAVVYLYKYF